MGYEKGWSSYVDVIASLLNDTEAADNCGNILPVEEAMSHWVNMTDNIRKNEGEISFIGNGASAGMASHYSADILKNGLVRTRVYTDIALLTATGNDFCFEQSFSAPLGLCMRSGDMLVAISSSGASPNILSAVHLAAKKGYVVTLSGFRKDNPLRKLGNINFYVPSLKYGLVETCHAALLHFWTDLAVASIRENI